MAKFKEKFLARKLRSRGESIKVIAKSINVSKSTVSRWCSDIFLSETQKGNLLKIVFQKSKKVQLLPVKIRRKNEQTG